MCLVIDIDRHQYEDTGFACRIFKPLIAKKSFTVYKILRFTKGILQTPFQGTPIYFISDETVMTAPMMSYYKSGWCVDIGIHAFEKKTSAQYYLKVFGSETPTYGLAIYEAIVPVGVKYFYGVDEDIVCEKLIIKNKTI